MRGLLLHALAALLGNKLCDVGRHSWRWDSALDVEVCRRGACRSWRRVLVLEDSELRARIARPVRWGDKFNDEGGR